jgi:hypothetical protein
MLLCSFLFLFFFIPQLRQNKWSKGWGLVWHNNVGVRFKGVRFKVTHLKVCVLVCHKDKTIVFIFIYLFILFF